MTTPGDNSQQAVALFCGDSMTQANSVAQLSQYVDIPVDAVYQMTYSYAWDWISDGGSGDVVLQAYMGANGPQNSFADGNVLDVWTTATVNGQMQAGDYNSVSFTLVCPQGVDGLSATVYIDSVSIGLPTCAANPNEILLNGDFECDNAAAFPSTIPGWVVTTSSATIQAITPGDDNSAQAVALSFSSDTKTIPGSQRISQTFNVPLDATYQMTFSYYWESVNEEEVGEVFLQAVIGQYASVIFADTLGIWATATVDGQLSAGDSSSVYFELLGPGGPDGISGTVWIDDVSVAPPPPTCAANPNEILMNGDFECDDAEYYPLMVPGWDVAIASGSSASVQAITPGIIVLKPWPYPAIAV